MINYHTVGSHCETGCRFSPLNIWAMTNLSWADAPERLSHCQGFYWLLGRAAAARQSKWLCERMDIGWTKGEVHFKED